MINKSQNIHVPFYSSPVYRGENEALANTLWDKLFSEKVDHNVLKNFYETYNDYFNNITKIIKQAYEHRTQTPELLAAASALKDELQEIFVNVQINMSFRKEIKDTDLLEVAEEKIEHREAYSREPFVKTYGKSFPSSVKEHYLIKDAA